MEREMEREREGVSEREIMIYTNTIRYFADTNAGR